MKEVSVLCYSGYKAYELPREVHLDEESLKIEEIIYRSVHETMERRERTEKFIVRLNNLKLYELNHNMEEDIWTIEEIEEND